VYKLLGDVLAFEINIVFVSFEDFAELKETFVHYWKLFGAKRRKRRNLRERGKDCKQKRVPRVKCGGVKLL
jgi:hypothetical protein